MPLGGAQTGPLLVVFTLTDHPPLMSSQEQALPPSLQASLAARLGGGSLGLRIRVVCLTRRDVNDELDELGEIARTLSALGHEPSIAHRRARANQPRRSD